jgi:S1-C subfamily serine protease
VHTTASTGAAFAILFAVVGVSFAYASMNPVVIVGEPWIGFRGTPLTPAIAEAVGTSEQTGFLVALVYGGSPADKAGLRGGDRVIEVEGEQLCAGGDLIVEVDGRPVTRAEDLEAALAGKSVGDTMNFTVVRGSVEFGIPVVLEETPEQVPPLPQC